MATLTSMNQGNPNNTRVDTYYGGTIPGVTVTARAKKKNVLSSIFRGVNNFLTSGLGGVFTSLGGSLLQNHLQKKAEQRANAEWQRRFNVQSAYNDPSAQARRLRVAGINPLSALGNSVSQATNPSVSQSSAPGVDLSGGVLTASQAGLVQQQEKTEVQTEALAKLNVIYESAIANNKPEMFETALQQAKQDLDTGELNQEQMQAQTTFIEKQTWLADLHGISEMLGWELTAANIENVYSQIRLNEAQAYQIFELTDVQKQQFLANVDKLIQETEDLRARNRYKEARAELEVAIMREQEKDYRSQRRNRTWNTVFNGLSTTAQCLATAATFTPAGRTKSLVGSVTESYDADGVLSGSVHKKNIYE